MAIRFRHAARRVRSPREITASSPSTPTFTGERWWGDTSPWNRLATSGTVASDSASFVSQLDAAMGNFTINQGNYTVTVWDVSVEPYSLKRVCQMQLPVGSNQYHQWWVDNVPIPTSAQFGNWPESPQDSEHHILIVDEANNRAYGFYIAGDTSVQAVDTDQSDYVSMGTHRHATTCTPYTLNGVGWWNSSLGPWNERASGASCGGGLIRRSELQAGVIPHALAFSPNTPYVRNTVVYPATVTDGTSGGFIPVGTWLTLDPSVNVATFPGLDAGQRVVAKAMQDYGMYTVDRSGTWSLYAENWRAGTNATGSVPSFYPGITMTGTLVPYLRKMNPPPNVGWDSRFSMGAPYAIF